MSTDELDDPEYVANGGDRCYHCKASLLAALAPLAAAESATVVLGVNLDDLGDHRPGQRAAAERGARFPLVDAGLTKDDVRAVSRHLGLRTWDKPAAACLASRVPYGTPVTLGTLGDGGGGGVGTARPRFRQLRVRHYGDLARVELARGRARARRWQRRAEVVAARARRRVPLRDPRPRGAAIGQPEPGPGGRRARVRTGAATRNTVIDVRVKLTFPEDLVKRPFIAELARDHEVEPNIRRANVDEHEGWIVCELEGEPSKVDGRPGLAARPRASRVDLLGDVVES